MSRSSSTSFPPARGFLLTSRLLARHFRSRYRWKGRETSLRTSSLFSFSSLPPLLLTLPSSFLQLAADFSITQFSFVTKLLVWHGRNSYKRSAKLAQFVIHRGLIISVMQAVFSAIFYFAPIALYQGWLMIGYATFYTMAPVFSLVLDRDVNEDVALLYPELYKELTKVSRERRWGSFRSVGTRRS